MRVLGEGEGGAAPHDQGEALVEGDLPGDLHTLLSQPAVRGERGRGEPGPDEHRAGQRIPGGDPEGEGVLGDPGRVEPGRGEGAARGQVRGEGEGGGRGGDGQEATAGQMPRGGAQFGVVRGGGERGRRSGTARQRHLGSSPGADRGQVVRMTCHEARSLHAKQMKYPQKARRAGCSPARPYAGTAPDGPGRRR